MLITDITTYHDIRAALGVDDEELEDDKIALDLHVNVLISDLEDVSLLVPEKFEELKDSPDLTAAESRFMKAAQVFATYSVARQLSGTLAIFSPIRIEDGKAGMARASDPHTATIKSINAQFIRWRDRLIQAFDLIGTPSTGGEPRPYLRVVSPLEDPNVGEG